MKNKNIKERKNLKMKRNLQETGITLIALVVTIIILLILAGVTVSLVVGENGLLQRAQTASNTMANATANEITQMGKYANEVDELTSGFIDNGGSQQGGTGGNGGQQGEEESISGEEIAKITEKIKTTTTANLQPVDYTPATTNDSVTIPGANNGGLSDQTFSQTSIGAIGDGKVSWYVLSADENGVNLVSSPTKQTVRFKDADGYDNCLYYLNEIATKLFANPEAGVTADRVHALRLSDIKEAAKSANGWSESDWTTNFVNQATSKSAGVTNIGDSKTYTSNTKYPRIYTADSNGAVTANNPMYDEEIATNYSPKTNDRIGSSTSTAASSLTVNGTYFGYYNSSASDKGVSNQLSKLSTFGQSGIAGNLFNSSGTNFWLASRCVDAVSSQAGFYLRYLYSGCLDSSYLALSYGGANGPSYALCVVVSVPGSRVNIDNDGTVTIK